MKTSKKVISLILTVVMIMTTFAVAAPMLLVETDAVNTSITDVETGMVVTQERVVGVDNNAYKTTYDNYAATYLNGASVPTDIVIPGLNSAQDYVVQGMTYYPERDWMLVTVYHNVADGETTQSSKVFALDAATGEFAAMFSFINVDGSINVDHGGGIAVSENNIYYSCGDKDQKIAYAPISALANAPLYEHTRIQLVDEVVLYELGDAYTAYVCYDDGVLWAGNFFDKGKNIAGLIEISADYNGSANSQYNSMVFGYKLAGNSSEEEWDHFKGTFQNRLRVASASGTGTAEGSTCTWNVYQNGSSMRVVGSITAPTAAVGEFIGNFGSFTLTEGADYTIEFTSTNNKSDMYMFSPVGTHCNVKQSTQTTITSIGNGLYHYSMNFTAGLKPTGADSSWPTTQSTDGSYTGTYTIRFDQDNIAAGEAREFELTNISITQNNTYENGENVADEGSAGLPSYTIGLNNAIKDVQYAVVDNGKLYLSRSYGSGTGNSETFGFGDCSLLSVADIDLSVPGTVDVTINSSSGTNTVKAHNISNYTDFRMMPMSEGLCVIDDNIFITFEGASNKYMNESSGLTAIGNCVEPVDVIWQFDPYALMEQEVAEPEKSIYYEKVYDMSEIENGKEYLIVYESAEKDPVTQEQILYAFNADGNFKDYKLSKSTSDVVKGYNGMIGHAITDYDLIDNDNDGNADILYLNDPDNDDVESVRWTLTNVSGANYRITSTESYFANGNNLYFDEDQITMAPGNASYLSNVQLMQLFPGNGDFYLSNGGSFFLWCNDGTNSAYNNIINSYYAKNSGTTPIYAGTKEQPGTFHCDAINMTGSNIIGASIPTDDGHYYEGAFHIYKRVVDEVASTYESRVYTNLGAELQEDGTYTVELETYAISPNHYQYVGERPTDYIIVADTSTSMDTADGTGIISYTDTLYVNSFCTKEMINQDAGTNTVNGYGFVSADEEIYLKHTDGRYYRVKLAVHTYDLKGIWGTDDQRFWAYYVADDGLYYVLQNSGDIAAGLKYEEFISIVDNGTGYTKQATNNNASDRVDTGLANCTHYRFSDYAGEFTRFTTLKTVAQNLVDRIAEQNSENRIAFVQYGADASTGFYNTSGTLSTTDYANAFWSVSSAEALKTKISGLTTSAQTSTAGVEMSYAKNIVANSGNNYKTGGTRNVAVILLSDGVPGSDSYTSDGATTAANNNIGFAGEIKDAGGFVYTVLFGHDSSGFDKKTYMEAVSSKYQAATSMGVLGGQSVENVNYTLNLSDCDIDYYLDFGLVAVEEIKLNSAVGLDNLDANSYLREQLSEAFRFPDDFNEETDVVVELIPGVFDKIGRFNFDDSASVKQDKNNEENVQWEVVEDDRTITVTNYNYSEQYIGKKKTTPGNKLRITITGLLANEAATIQNTSINNTATTGIYKTKDIMDAPDGVAFKYLPTEYFNIPEYTYVLDYGLPMYDYAVNGTLKSVESDLSAIPRNSDGTPQYNKISENGLVEITNENLDLIYRSTPTNFADSGYCLIQRDDGTYDWFEIKVVPASNVLFEESYLENGKSGSVEWATDGEALDNYQSLTNDETDIYGFDEAYDTTTHAHSNGSASKATVTSSAKRSTTKTFDFIGEGFDLISACGENTGIVVVKVSGGNLERPKSFIVDTYYNGAYVNDSGLLCQTPVVGFTGAHGTYTVEVTATYLSTASALNKSLVTGKTSNGKLSGTTGALSVTDTQALLNEIGMSELADTDVELVWFDDNSVLNGGTGAKGNTRTARDGTTTNSLDCYIDGFRIYHPMAHDEVEYIDKEQDATYLNVIDSINSNVIDTETTSIDGIGYIVGSLEEGTSLSFDNYETHGPQNELYLNGSSNAIILKVQLPNSESKVHLGLRAVTGTAAVKIGSTDWVINGPTEMYYDITKCVAVDETGIATITIQNTGANVLAVNNIKLTGSAAVTTITSEDMDMAYSLMTAEAERADVINGVVTPVVEDDTTGDDAVTDDGATGDDTTDDSSTGSMSFIEQLIAMIMEIIQSLFNFLPVGEVM